MKIDENCVNHNVVRLIKNDLLALESLSKEDIGERETEIMRSSIAYIKGIIDMADAMKVVIKE